MDKVKIKVEIKIGNRTYINTSVFDYHKTIIDLDIKEQLIALGNTLIEQLPMPQKSLSQDCANWQTDSCDCGKICQLKN